MNPLGKCVCDLPLTQQAPATQVVAGILTFQE